jgi:IS5 family transposase
LFPVKQQSFSDAEYGSKKKSTRREVFLAEMDRVVPWTELEALIAPHYPKVGNGRPPYPLAAMLRIHFLQQWYALSDPAMEEALYDIASMRQFTGLSLSRGSLPDETTILNFRHLLERHGLAVALFEAVKQHLQGAGLLLQQGTIVDATIIAAPSSTKNSTGRRDPEMHQTRKGNQWYFGMKAHIGTDADSGLVHSVIGTSANVGDVTQAHGLLHGEEEVVFADAGYIGVEKRPEAPPDVEWRVAMKAGKRRALGRSEHDRVKERIEQLKASVRSRGEHAFRVLKRQFGHAKVRYRGLAKNTAQLHTLFALVNIWMVRRKLLRLRPTG